jgi:glycosyltransferase involved in cell wall biosynthesis
MKILVIISEAPPIRSGVARVCEEINSRLRAAGHVVDTISVNDIPRLELGEVRLSSMLWKGIGQVFPRMKEYDLIHIHGPVPTFSDVALLFAALARAGGGPRIAYTHHCEIELPGKEAICAPYNFFHRSLTRLADHIVVSTPGYAHSFKQFLPEERVSIIPWGVDAHAEPRVKPDGFHILFVGQLRPYKGLDVLLRAFQQLEHAKLTIIGSGHQADEYQALARRLSLQNVHFLGKASEDVMKLAYNEAHALVLPSLTRAEAFGIVLLEGMSAGCVPIASELMGLTDVVGEVGYTFPPNDDLALANVLRKLQHEHSSRGQLSFAARRWSEQFSWENAAQAYADLFTRLVQQGTSASMNWFPQPIALARQIGASMPAAPAVSALAFPYSLSTLFERIVRDFDASQASLLWRLPAEDNLVISAHQGLNDGLLGARVPLRDSVAGWVARAGQPLFIDHANAPQEVRAYMHKPELSSALSVPLMHENHVVGVLNLARRGFERAYNLDDLRDLVASVASITYQEQPTTNLLGV